MQGKNAYWNYHQHRQAASGQTSLGQGHRSQAAGGQTSLGQGHRSQANKQGVTYGELKPTPKATGKLAEGNADMKRPSFKQTRPEQPQRESRRNAFGGIGDGGGAKAGVGGTAVHGDIIINTGQGAAGVGKGINQSGNSGQLGGQNNKISDSMTGGTVKQDQIYAPTFTGSSSGAGGAGGSGGSGGYGKGGAGGAKAGAGGGGAGLGGAGRGGAGAAGGAGGRSGNVGDSMADFSGVKFGSPTFQIGRNKIGRDTFTETRSTSTTDARKTTPAKEKPASKKSDPKKPAAETETPAEKAPAAKTPAAKTPAAKTPAAKTPAAKKPDEKATKAKTEKSQMKRLRKQRRTKLKSAVISKTRQGQTSQKPLRILRHQHPRDQQKTKARN